MNTPSTLISTPSALASLLTTLTFALPPNPSTPSLYIDLEGVNLCRHGTISLLTVYVLPLGHVYLIDVHTLASLAFTTPCPCTGATLGSLLASPTVPKAFFDVRNDSDALFAHYGVRLAAVEDVQLMENAGRTGRHRLSGLERCVESHLGPGTGTGLLSEKEHSAWCAVKDEGKKLFAPELGGGYEVFEERPMRPEVERYCVNDVVLLPLLRKVCRGKLGRLWKKRVAMETEKRVREPQMDGYDPDGKNKGKGPWWPDYLPTIKS